MGEQQREFDFRLRSTLRHLRNGILWYIVALMAVGFFFEKTLPGTFISTVWITFSTFYCIAKDYKRFHNSPRPLAHHAWWGLLVPFTGSAILQTVYFWDLGAKIDSSLLFTWVSANFLLTLFFALIGAAIVWVVLLIDAEGTPRPPSHRSLDSVLERQIHQSLIVILLIPSLLTNPRQLSKITGNHSRLVQ